MKLRFVLYFGVIGFFVGSYLFCSACNKGAMVRALDTEKDSSSPLEREQELKEELNFYKQGVIELNRPLEQGYKCNQALQDRINDLKALKKVQDWQKMIEGLHAPDQLPENYLANESPEQLKYIVACLQLALAQSRRKLTEFSRNSTEMQQKLIDLQRENEQLRAELKVKSEEQFTFVPTTTDPLNNELPSLLNDQPPVGLLKNNSSLDSIDD